jgi:glucosamine--fructose-6-phosphate aminotransferase (isomerizing)
MTDSEVFAHLIERAYKRCHNVEEAFVTALNQVEGAFATAMLTVHQPEYLYCAKNISPLILGMGEERHYIGSDINAFLEFTKTAISLDDDDYAILSKEYFPFDFRHG